MTEVFPSVLTTAKVVPVFKKDSKLYCSNYHPISLLSNVEKILGKLMYKISLNSNKDSGPNSIVYRILLLLKNEIWM